MGIGYGQALEVARGGAKTLSGVQVCCVILPPVMAGNDADTIKAVLEGDVDRYAELVAKYQGPTLRLAFSLVGNYEDARELSQNGFVKAYRHLRRFRGRASFSTWLYRIVVNECKDFSRRSARRPQTVSLAPDPEREDPGLFEVADPGADPGERLANQELARQLSEAIGRLPMKQRTAFVLHHVHGMSLEEVSGVMGCRVGTVKAHVFRATEQLRGRLEPFVMSEGARA